MSHDGGGFSGGHHGGFNGGHHHHGGFSGGHHHHGTDAGPGVPLVNVGQRDGRRSDVPFIVIAAVVLAVVAVTLLISHA